jgi:hypothetical protein
MRRWRYIAIALAGAGIAALILGSPNQLQQSATRDEEPEVLSIREMFARGIYQHLVETRFDVEAIDVRRGESITVPFTVEHLSHVWWEPATAKNFRNKFANYSPSGEEVPADKYLRYSPPSILIPSNSSARGSVMIAIPSDISDEMIGETIKITASFDLELQFTDESSRARKPGILGITILA